MSAPAISMYACAVCHALLPMTVPTNVATPDCKRPLGIIVADGHLMQTIYAVSPQHHSQHYYHPEFTFTGVPHTRVCSYLCLQRYAQTAERERRRTERLEEVERELSTQPLYVTGPVWEFVTSAKVCWRRLMFRLRRAWETLIG